MTKDPFDLSAIEREARRIFRDPVISDLRQAAILGVDQQLQERAMMQAARFESPLLKIAKDMAEQQALISKRHREMFAPLSERLGVTDKFSTMASDLSRQFAGIGAFEQFKEQQRQYKEALRPFRSMVVDLDQQQRAFIQSMRVMDLERWSTLTASINQGLLASIKSGAFAAESEIASTLAVRLEALDQAAPGDPATAALLFAALRFVLDQLAKAGRGLAKLSPMDLMNILGLILTIHGALNPPYTDEDRGVAVESLKEIRETSELLKQAETRAAAAVEAQAAMEHLLEHMPRAVVVGAGRVRAGPSAKDTTLTNLPRDTVVAVLQQSGRWREVMYSDPLSQTRERGWIYATSLQMLGRG